MAPPERGKAHPITMLLRLTHNLFALFIQQLTTLQQTHSVTWVSRQQPSLAYMKLGCLLIERKQSVDCLVMLRSWLGCRVDKKRDKLERKVLDSQERAFWDVHRPAVSLFLCLRLCLLLCVYVFVLLSQSLFCHLFSLFIYLFHPWRVWSICNQRVCMSFLHQFVCPSFFVCLESVGRSGREHGLCYGAVKFWAGNDTVPNFNVAW